MRKHTRPDVLSIVQYAIVFCTRYRLPVLQDPALAVRLEALLREKARELGLTLREVRVAVDHVTLV